MDEKGGFEKGDPEAKMISELDSEMEANISAFEALEREFQQVLAELVGDEGLETFRLEYEKLHRALKKSHEQEKRLVKKCRELNTEILSNQAKIKTALRLSQEDQKTITHLQKEMEKTWKMVYMSQEKEGRAKENITLLKEELATLSRLVERGASLSVSQENDVKQLRLAREELQRQVEEQSVQIALLEGKLFEQNNYHVDLREQVAQHLATITDMKDRLASKESDSLREVKRRVKTQKELQDARILLEEKGKAQETLAMEVEVSKAQNIELQRQLQEAHTTMEKYLRDYDTLYNRTQKVTTDLEQQANENRKLQVEHVAIDKEMKLRLAEIGRLKTENQLLERRVDTEHKTGLQYKQLAADAKNPLLEAQSEITKLKAELISVRRLESGLERKAETIAREKETQMKLHLRAEGKVKEQTELKMEQEKLAEDLGREVKESVEESLQLRKVIHQLDRDRERLVNELGEQKGINAKSLEDVKTKNMQISELHKNINDWETRLKQQQQLYERARSDRAHYSKNLIESQDEIAELLKKSKIMSQQIEQLKEEIQVKEEGMVKEHFEFQRADKLKDYLQNEVNDKNLLIRRNMELSQLQADELKKLTAVIRRMDDEASAQRKEYDQVVSQRDIVGTQLIRRNDELALLYEKLRVQQSALSAGEAQYAARVDDIRVLRARVLELTREDTLGRSVLPQVSDLKKEILKLQQALYNERLKVTALSEELENPLNVHRWRKLEGSDPAGFELIQKVQTLQKRLISKTEEVVEKALVIKEKDKMYAELKAMLARQPGPEVAEQLSVYQINMKQKTRQMKALAAELNMYQAQVNEYKYDVERITRELQETKKKYYQLKGKEETRMLQSLDGSQLPAGVGKRVMSKPSSSITASGPLALEGIQQEAAKSARVQYTGGGYVIK